jgi:hypothetical protein
MSSSQRRFRLYGTGVSIVSVLRQQDATFNKGFLQNFIIRDVCLSFKHISDIVTISPEAGDDAGIATLIGKQSHFFTAYPKAILITGFPNMIFGFISIFSYVFIGPSMLPAYCP